MSLEPLQRITGFVVAFSFPHEGVFVIFIYFNPTLTRFQLLGIFVWIFHNALNMDGPPGIEPGLTDSKSAVLPITP